MGLFGKKKKAHTPVEAKESGRSKQRVKIVEILSEGEIEGLVDGLKSVRLDNTPIEAADGSHYFKNVEVEGRVGTQTQEVMAEFQAVEKEISVATEVTKRTALTRTVTDANVNRLRLTLGVQALFEQNNQGDTNPTTVELKITVGNQVIPFTIQGKYSSSYSG